MSGVQMDIGILEHMSIRTEAEEMYVIIGYHLQPGQYYNFVPYVFAENKQHALDFWTRFFSRYKDKDHCKINYLKEWKV